MPSFAAPADTLGQEAGRWRVEVLTRPASWLWIAVVLALGYTVAVLPAPYAVLAVGGLAIVALVLARPVLGLPLVLFSVPFGSLAEVELGSFSVSATEPLVALLTVSWLLRGVRERRISFRVDALVGVIVLLVALALLSVTYAEAPALAFKEALKWVELLLVLLITVDLVRDRQTATWLLGSLFVAGALEAAWGAGLAVVGSGPAAFALGGAIRASGHFDQPNPFAGYLATILPLAVAMAVAPTSSWRFRGLAGGAAVVLAGAILVSQSRGAWLGLALAGLVLVALWSPRSRRLLAPLLFGALFVVTLSAAGFLPAALLERVGQVVDYFGVFDVRTVELTSENWAVVERMAHWQAGWYMFLAQPWLGVGAGNYAEAYQYYYVKPWLDPLGHAHNYYLNTLAELGLVGLSLLLAFLALTLRRTFRGLRAAAFVNRHGSPAIPPSAGASWSPPSGAQPLRAHRPPAVMSHTTFWRLVLAGVFGALLVFCTHSLFDNLFVHGINTQVGFLIGLVVVAGDRLRDARDARGMV